LASGIYHLKIGQNEPAFEWLKQDGDQQWFNHLITGPKWDHFIALNGASKYGTI
jgi:hypothetical protein